MLLALWLAMWAALLFTFNVVIQERDSDVVLYFGMQALTFPSGFLVVWLLKALGSVGFYLPNGVLGQYIFISIFVLVGYCQWFILLPRLVHLFHRAQPSAPGDAPPKGVAP
jgi:hypothetical protein